MRPLLDGTSPLGLSTSANCTCLAPRLLSQWASMMTRWSGWPRAVWGGSILLLAVAAATPHAEELPSPPAGWQWQLIWQDEFDGTRLDPQKWEVCGDWPRRDGWWVKDDAYVDGQGHLILRTRQQGDRFTCGAVRTQGKFEHAHGYWTARCELPRAPGHWPAFWLMCPGVTSVGNGGRDGTEIDIAEFPWRDGRTTMNLHWDGYGSAHQSAGTRVTLPAITNGFHTFSLWWKTNEYVFYVDGREVWRSAAGGVSQVPEYIKLTEEIGPWAGDIKQAKLPDYFRVDYVRVYDLVPAGPAKPGTP